jgi:hypothetical protein
VAPGEKEKPKMKVESIDKTLLQILTAGPTDDASLSIARQRLDSMARELTRRVVEAVMATVTLPAVLDASERARIEAKCIQEFQNHWLTVVRKACSTVAQMNTQRPS